MTRTDKDSYRAEIYDRYLSTTYAARNDMTEKGIRGSVRKYDLEIAAFMPESPEAEILEIGCGKGGFLTFCKELGYSRVTGLDISPEQVELCQQRGFEDVFCSDGLSYLRDTDKTFAMVVMSDVLEHLSKEEALDTLREIHAHLEPGGRVFLRVPNLSNPWNVRTRYVDFTHELGFTKESLAQVLRVTGFEIEMARGSFYPHRRWLARLVFDRLLWKLFLLFYRHTLHLKNDPERGKNLIAVGRKGASDTLPAGPGAT